MGICDRLTKFKEKFLVMKKKNTNFADEYDVDDPVGALAFTDFTKPAPVLEGEDAERFVRMMEENERKAEERAKIPPTKEELENRLNWMKLVYNFEKQRLEENEKEIKELEEEIKKLDGKTKEE
jgi:flagellar motility protein MotE (MotC chaperone)